MERNTDYILRQLATTFTVRDIMTPREDLVTGDTLDAAINRSAENPDFSIIPIVSNGEIGAYVKRKTHERFEITRADLVSDGTGVLEAADLLRNKEFFFALRSNAITGLVNRADLSNSIVKLPLYALTEAVERRLWLKIEDRLDEEVVRAALPSKEEPAVLSRRRRAETLEIGTRWMGCLYFSHILAVARHLDSVQLSNEDAADLVVVRNLVSHSDKVLTKKRDDVERLVRVRHICERILAG